MIQEYSNFKTQYHTETHWCFYCYGSGAIRKRDMGIIPRITFEKCRKCKNKRRLWYIPDTRLCRIARNIIIGQSPGIRKSNDDRGWNRR